MFTLNPKFDHNKVETYLFNMWTIKEFLAFGRNGGYFVDGDTNERLFTVKSFKPAHKAKAALEMIYYMTHKRGWECDISIKKGEYRVELRHPQFSPKGWIGEADILSHALFLALWPYRKLLTN